MWDFTVDIFHEGQVSFLLVGAFILACLFAVGWFVSWRMERQDLALLRAIADVEEGREAIVEGEIVALETILSPYEEKEAVVAKLWTRQVGLSAEYDYDSKSVGPETSTSSIVAKDFLVDDGSGVLARVDTSYVAWGVGVPKFGSDHYEGIPEKLWEFLESSGLDMNDLAASPTLSFAEARLIAGDRVRIRGVVRFEADPGGKRGYREISRRPVLVAPEDKELMIELA